MDLVYYDESILLAMTSTMGRPTKLVERTLNADMKRFTRICVEIKY
ncbi:hypothetical protein A2U01_0096306 [Trifolium medium]|uniref:Uncharacterized protein n=1 Tax=Trifolium medium TaxID=97028 RepID=A0A392UN20_9FABA|nr:hypothetical protein [Trifolium medium]